MLVVILIALLGIGNLVIIIRNIIVFKIKVKQSSAIILTDKYYYFGIIIFLIIYTGYLFCLIYEYIKEFNRGLNFDNLLYFGFVFGILGWSANLFLEQGVLAISEKHLYVYNKVFEYNKNSIVKVKNGILNRKIVDFKGDNKNVKIRLDNENFNLLKQKIKKEM